MVTPFKRLCGWTTEMEEEGFCSPGGSEVFFRFQQIRPNVVQIGKRWCVRRYGGGVRDEEGRRVETCSRKVTDSTERWTGG